MPLLAPIPNWTDVPNRCLGQGYARAEVVSQVKPTLATLPASVAPGLSLDTRNANPSRYEKAPEWVAPPKFGLIVAVPPTLANWSPTIGQPKVTLKYAPGDWVAPPKFGLIVAVSPTLANWTPTFGQPKVNLRYALPEYVTQVRPTLATLPTILNAAEMMRPANPPVFSRALEFVAPDKFGLTLNSQIGFQANAFQHGLLKAFQVLDTTDPSKWYPNTPANAVTLYYTRALEFVAPGKFLPTVVRAFQGNAFQNDILGSIKAFQVSALEIPTVDPNRWLPNIPPSKLILKYTPTSDFVAPARVIATPPAPAFGWFVPTAQNSVVLYYQKVEDSQMKGAGTGPVFLPVPVFIEQPPTLAPRTFASAPSFVSSTFTPQAVQTPQMPASSVAQSGLRIICSRAAEYVAPSRVLPFTTPAFQFNAFQSDLSGSIKAFQVATSTILTIDPSRWLPTTPPPRLSLPYARALEFIYPSTTVAAVQSTDLNRWLSNIAQQPVVLNYSSRAGDVVYPGVITPAPPVPDLNKWLGNVAVQRVSLSYARGTDVVYPGVVVVTVAASLVSAWYTDKAPSAVVLYYQKVEDSQMKGASTPQQFPITLAAWLKDAPPNALPQQFSKTTEPASPTRFGLVVVATPTVASWKATEGEHAIVLKYAQGEAVGQVRPTLATLPTLLAGISEIAPNAQPQKFAPVDWSAPAKFGLVAPPSLSSWKSTDGEHAVVLRYAPTDYVTQANPTLATLPTLLAGISEIAPNAQPQKFAPVDWSAPAKFNLTVAAPLQIAGWLSTDGQKQVVLKYAPTEIVRQEQPTLATLPVLPLPQEQPPTVTAPEFVKAESVAPPSVPQSFVASWLQSIQALPVFAKFVQAENRNAPVIAQSPTTVGGWLSQALDRAPVIKYWLAEALSQVFVQTVLPPLGENAPSRSGNPVPVTRTGEFSAPDKFTAAPTPVSSWAVEIGQRAVKLTYTLPEALLQILGPGAVSVLRRFGTPQEVIATLTTQRNSNQEALARVASVKQSADEILRTVAPKQATTVYEVLRGAASGLGTPQEAAGKVTGIARIPNEIILQLYEPVTLLAGKVTPLIGILSGKIVQAISVTTGVITEAIIVRKGRVID